MIVLSLFDGMSCGRIALERAGIKVNKYFASEVKKSAIKVSKDNYPDIIHIGDVTKITFSDGVLYTETGNYDVGHIDLLIGGSPCQDFSIARTMADKTVDGLKGGKSSLFYEYLRIKKETKPSNFLLENVKMKKESKKSLDDYLGVIGEEINSSLLSYQKRGRVYWSNLGVTQPQDSRVSFQDFKETNYDKCKPYKLNATKSRIYMWSNGEGRNSANTGCANVTNSEKVYCLTRKQDRSPNSGLVEFDGFCRYLTREELEQAQTVPLGYTKAVSYNQAQDLLGDGWTVDVIAHIFKGLTKENYE